MEPTSAATLEKSNSNTAITKLGGKSRKPSKSNAELKKTKSKKRGVYVEKWVNPKQVQAEDKKRQARGRAQSKSWPERTGPTSHVNEANLSSVTQPVITPDTDLAREQHKPLSKTVMSTTSRVSKQNSNKMTTNKNQCDIKPQRNIVEMNKNQAKMKKFRSNVLRQAYATDPEKVITFKAKRDIMITSSNTSKLTKDTSPSTHWSHIFPNDTQNSVGNRSPIKRMSENSRLNLYRKKDNEKKKESGQDQNIYNFLVDLLEKVYDEKRDKVSDDTLAIVHSSDSSKINLEIDESVADKLYITEQNEQPNSNRYTITDTINDTMDNDQSKMLADYYNRRARLLPPNTVRRRRKTTINKAFAYTRRSAYTKPEVEVKTKKSKKHNLLNLLKEQLTVNYNFLQEEPDNMYEALRTMARNKNKYRQIRFDTPDKSEYEGVCRFKRRKVISPSRQPRKVNVLMNERPINNARGKYERPIKNDRGRHERPINNTRGRRRLSAASTDKSNHSLEVYGYDYEEILEPEPELESEYSDDEPTLTHTYVRRSIPNLNQGLKTITQFWRR